MTQQRFELGEELLSTREAIEWGACTKPLRGRVVGFSYDPEIIYVRLKGKKGKEPWHQSFWRSIEPQIAEREDMWGEKTK
jgi:hypothetical protein